LTGNYRDTTVTKLNKENDMSVKTGRKKEQVVDAAALVRSFVEHMVEEHDWDIPVILEFLGKPHKWQGEMEEFLRTGKVADDDTSDG
tara:strand:+ start:890 stop:1150 length:261 start_codon:yes stop_codon:yes gene_type:complete